MGKVFCKKYNKELDALPFPPIPGEKGMSIMQNFSREAWDAWVDLQTMLINEHKLNMMEPNARKFLEEKMSAYLFDDVEPTIEGYVPPEK